MVAIALTAACSPGHGGGPSPPSSLDRRGAAARGPAAEQLVVLISVDGLAPWVLADTETPTLDRLAREGTAAVLARTVVPSRTLPSHTSMISGVGPDRHGVLWNRWEPGRGVHAETVFTHCARARVRCGLFVAKPKFAHLALEEPGVERYQLASEASDVLEAALDYVDESRPGFVMIHLAEVDLAGHRAGWGSRGQREAIRTVDAALDDFLDELLDEWTGRVTLILTSDHGGRGFSHGGDAAHDVEIPWIAWGAGVPAGRRIPRVRTEDTAATVLSLLGLPVPRQWVGKSHHPFYVGGGAPSPADGHAPGGSP